MTVDNEIIESEVERLDRRCAELMGWRLRGRSWVDADGTWKAWRDVHRHDHFSPATKPADAALLRATLAADGRNVVIWHDPRFARVTVTTGVHKVRVRYASDLPCRTPVDAECRATAEAFIGTMSPTAERSDR